VGGGPDEGGEHVGGLDVAPVCRAQDELVRRIGAVQGGVEVVVGVGWLDAGCLSERHGAWHLLLDSTAQYL
jgi:hypothetical protein